MPEITIPVPDGKILRGTLLDYLSVKYCDLGLSEVQIKHGGEVKETYFFQDDGSLTDANEIVVKSDNTIDANKVQWIIDNHKTMCKDKIPPIVEGLIAALAPHVGMTKEVLRQAAIDSLADSA